MANANNRQDFDRYYTEEEEKKLFKLIKRTDHILAKRDLAWMQFLRFTGVRIGILGGKTLKENGKKVGLVPGITVGEAREAITTKYLNERAAVTKTGKAKATYVSVNAISALNDLLKIRRQMGYPMNMDAPLIMGQKGNGLSVRQYQERFKHWADLAGVKGSPHWMRHTTAKRIMKNSTASDPRALAQVQLGHANINSTAVYTAPDKEDLAFFMEQVS